MTPCAPAVVEHAESDGGRRLGILDRLCGPLTLPAGPLYERHALRVIALVRVAFGLLCAHRALDLAGFSLLAQEPEAFAWRQALEFFLALGIAAGALTPMCLALLLALCAGWPVMEYLGLQVLRMVAWGLLLSGAGLRYGVDAWALRRPRLARVIGPLYVLAPMGTSGLGGVRFLLLALYWTVALSGVRYHVDDAFWHRGEVLQLATTMAYMSDHWVSFAEAARVYPRVFDTLCRVGLYVQAFWQLALLPLFYVPHKVVRAFVVGQGWAFFLVGTFVLNLGYLGVFELCLWGLIFGVAPRFGIDPLLRGPAPPPETRARRAVLAVGLLGGFLLLAANALGIADVAFGTRTARPVIALSGPLAKVFGLFQVNVFNRKDIQLGTFLPLLLETDGEGRVLRVVPFVDRHGGRLDYLRNDLLYFRWSLRWQRLAPADKVPKNRKHPMPEATLSLWRGVARLDACLTGGGHRLYRGILLGRSIADDGPFPVWTDARPIVSVAVTPGDGTTGVKPLTGLARLLGCYDLPPGHPHSRQRARETLIWARGLGPP